MADTQLLRNSAIVRNASVGASRPPPVSTGALPLVQVKMTQAGPQVQEGQQKPVTILAPNSKGVVATGALPMVQVKMTQNGPQLDNGQETSVVIRDNKQSVAAGALPMVHVKMDGGKSQIQNVPQQQSKPPQIPMAAPVLSQPRVTRVVVPAPIPAALPLPPPPPSSELSTDQWMLCRHLVDKYRDELLAAAAPEGLPEDSTADTHVRLAEETIAAIDQTLLAFAAQIEAQNVAASAAATAPVASVGWATPVQVVPPAVAQVAMAAASLAHAAPPAPTAAGYVAPRAVMGNNGYVTPRPSTGGQVVPAAVVPQAVPRHGYVAPRPGVRGRVIHGNAAFAPRRVPRPATPLPMVEVKMDGGQPVVQQPPVVQQAVDQVVMAETPVDPAGVTPEAPTMVTPEASGSNDAQE